MPRKSPFGIRLSREERRVLDTRSHQYTLPYRDFATEDAAAQRILGFRRHYQAVAHPFE